MAIHLKRGEYTIWKSYPGKNYRLLILFRDLILGVLSSLIFYFGLKEYEIVSAIVTTWISVVILLLWVLLALVNQISLMLIKYLVTNERIIIKRGWLNRNLIDIPNGHVVTTEVKQSLQERLINSGTIYIKTANDVNTTGDKIANIDNPFFINTIISEVVDDDAIKNDE